nr:hypothetical protein [Legionella jordanis]
MINVCCDTVDNPAPVHLIGSQLKRVNPTSPLKRDFSLTFPTVQSDKSIEDFTTVTLIENSEQILSSLYQTKYSLIDKRNKILASYFNQFKPFRKKSLAKIDKQIDLIDEEIYSIESKNFPSEEDLNNIVEKAQRKFNLLTRK